MVNTVKGWNSPYTIKKFTKFILTIIIVALHSTMAEETSVNSSSINSVTANDLNEDDCATTIPQILPTDVTIQNEASLPPIDHGTKNGMQIEFQNCLSMIYYAFVSAKTMRTEEIASRMCEQLFSNSTRMGYAKQLMKGECHLTNLFNRMPVESHELNNNSNTIQCRLKVKQILVGRNAKPWMSILQHHHLQ